jgi:predicted exporter
MAIAYIALGAMFVIMIFRSVGVGAIQSRGLKEEGKPKQARYRMAWLAMLWSGVVVGVIGASAGIQFLRVIGIVVFIGSFIAFFLFQAEVIRDARKKSKK